MTLYIVIFLFLSCLSLAEEYAKPVQRNWLFPISIIVIGAFQALRWDTGTDWDPYYDFFIHSNNPIRRDEAGFEIGYTLLNQYIRSFSASFTSFLFVECFLNLFFIVRFAKDMRMNKCLMLLISFCLSTFPIRYTLASNIILCSYKYIKERRIFPFLLLYILAFSIHRSIIIFLPVFFLVRRVYSAFSLLFVFFLATVIGLLAEKTFENVLWLISLFYGQIGDSFQNKLDAYVTGEIPDYAVMSTTRLLIAYANSIFFISLFCYFRKKFFKDNALYNILLNLYVIGLSFNRIFLQIIPDFARATSLFTGGFPVLIWMIINCYSRKNKFVLLILLIVYYYFIYQSATFKGYYWYLFVPYYSIFSSGARLDY